MPSVTGAKLYVAAVLAVAMVMRATIGESPFSADDQETVGWVLNGIVAGLTVIVGPEFLDGLKAMVGRLSGKSEPDEGTK